MPKAERPEMLNIHDYITTRHLALQHDKGIPLPLYPFTPTILTRYLRICNQAYCLRNQFHCRKTLTYC